MCFSWENICCPDGWGLYVANRCSCDNPKRFNFTKPKVKGLNFSFSGLKTAILYFIRNETIKNENFINQNINDICASIQYTIIGILLDKLKKSVEQTGIKRIAIGGGVSANSGIRKKLKKTEKIHEWKVYIPAFEFTTDNAAMIAIVGYLKYQKKEFTNQETIAEARMKL